MAGFNFIEWAKGAAAKFGLLGGIQHVKQGRGVIAKLSMLAVVGILVIGSIALLTDGADVRLQCVYVIAGIVVFGMLAGYLFGLKNPHDGVSEKTVVQLLDRQLAARNPVPFDQRAQHVIRAPDPPPATLAVPPSGEEGDE